VTESNDPLGPIIARLREPVDLAPDLAARVMAELGESEHRTATTGRAPTRAWWRRRWTVQISPLGGLGLAAAVAGLVLVGSLLGRQTSPGPSPAAVASAGTHPTQFVLVAPDARQVTVVGDFNDWNLVATPLTRAEGDGVWSVTIPLAAGRYRYAFVVDGAVWRGDPEAPALEDEFGQPNSEMTVGGA